jgi:hypothetical protein
VANTSFVGSDAYFEFGGTAINTQFRSIEDNQTGDTVDGSAGADTFRRKLFTLVDGGLTLDVVAFAGGTAVLTNWIPGREGTIIFGEEGTATNKPKTTVSANITGRRRSIPYDGVVTYSFDFGYLEAPTHANY